MSKEEEFKKIIKELSNNSVYIVPGSFNGYTKPCNFYCNKGHYFTIKTPGNIKRNLKTNKPYSCPKCSLLTRNEDKRKTPKEFEKELKELYPNGEYKYMGGYINNNNKVKILHNTCNKIYTVYPKNILYHGAKCPHCQNRYHKNTEEFKLEVYEKVGDEYTILSNYETNDKKVKFRHNCDRCKNNEFEMTPTNFLHGQQRCPKCSNIIRQSKGERRVEEYLKLKNYKYEKYYEFDELGYFSEKAHKIINYPFDFLVYTESAFFMIEFDGRQHECGFNGNADSLAQNIKNDAKKTKYCEDNNIPLLRISYKDERQIENIIDKYISDNSFKIKLNDYKDSNESK